MIETNVVPNRFYTMRCTERDPLMWHVHMNGSDEIWCHSCMGHKVVAESLECPTCPEPGDCAHVQHRPCDCSVPQPCSICPEHDVN